MSLQLGVTSGLALTSMCMCVSLEPLRACYYGQRARLHKLQRSWLNASVHTVMPWRLVCEEHARIDMSVRAASKRVGSAARIYACCTAPSSVLMLQAHMHKH